MSVVLMDDADAFKTTGYCVWQTLEHVQTHSSVCSSTCLLCMQYPVVDIQSPFLSVLFLELVMFYCQIIELLVPLCLLLLVPKVATAGKSV